MPAARRIAYLLAAATVALTACSNTKSAVSRQPQSGSASASAVAGVQQITLEAGDDYRFHPSTFTVHPGRVEVILKHPGTGAPHNWQLVDFPADFVPLTPAGQTSMATFTAPPLIGREKRAVYKFECTIHVAQGQVGTMIVAAPLTCSTC
jgi:plastocyanin